MEFALGVEKLPSIFYPYVWAISSSPKLQLDYYIKYIESFILLHILN